MKSIVKRYGFFRELAGALILLGSVYAAWATPSVSWVSLPSYLQPSGGWYVGPQAKGEDCVLLKVEVAAGPDAAFGAFSCVGSRDGDGTVYSDSNACHSPSAIGGQIFRAVAVNAAGESSAPVFWVVKSFPGAVSPLRDGIGRSYSIAFSDLPKLGSARIMPFANNTVHDKALLESIICSLTGDHTAGKILEFQQRCYRYNLGPIGQMAVLVNVGNLTIRSSAAGMATLKWNTETGAGGGFLTLNKQCRAITLAGLQFDTEVSQRFVSGSHLLIRGSNITVSHCRFYRAPGFAIYVGDGWECAAGEVPDNVHIDANIIADTFSDGIHVATAKNLYLVGNVISSTTDDAIAFINDAYYTGDVGGATRGYQSENVHALWNHIERSGSRGVVVQNAIGGSIDHNTIEYTAGYGVEFQGMTPPSGGVPRAEDCPRSINITRNVINKSGWYPQHTQVSVPREQLTTAYQPYKHGVYLSYFNLPINGSGDWVECADNSSLNNSGSSYSFNKVSLIHFRNLGENEFRVN